MANENDVTVPLTPHEAPKDPAASGQQPAQPHVNAAVPNADETSAGEREAEQPTVIHAEAPNAAEAKDAGQTAPFGGGQAAGATQPLPDQGAAEPEARAWAPSADAQVDEKFAAQVEYLRAKEEFKAASKKAGKRTPQIAASIAIAAVLLFGGGAAGWAIGSSGGHAGPDAQKAPQAIENTQDEDKAPRGYLNAPGNGYGDSQGQDRSFRYRYGNGGSGNDGAYGHGYGNGGGYGNDGGYGNVPDADDGTDGQAPGNGDGSGMRGPRGGYGQQGAPGAPNAQDQDDSNSGKMTPQGNGSGDGADDGAQGSGDSGSSDSKNSDNGSSDSGSKGKNGQGNTSRPNNNGSDTGSFWNGNGGK